MATENEALALAGRALGRPSTDSLRPWRLIEFPEGWLIEETVDSSKPETIGAARLVIERETGRVMRFPSSVPPRRIVGDYQAVVTRGFVEDAS